ncbi:MAG: CerR family C-terminal domain-containing protein [Myxococcota bacterium]|nr:CerR family C-terminal domain-containing protein [Myxococcota bacterium]
MAARRASSESPDARGEAARQALIIAALESFGRYGFDAASVRDICDRAGANVAAVNYHFGSKEGLYLAVAEFLANGMAMGTAHVLEPSRVYLATGKRTAEATEQHLGGLLRALVLSMFANVRDSSPALFVLREQSEPTSAFALIFERLLKPMHETITALVADRIGIAATDLEAVIRAHALISQCVGFKAAKAALQKRTGWSSADDPGQDNVELIADVVVEHSIGALRAVAAGKRRGGK